MKEKNSSWDKSLIHDTNINQTQDEDTKISNKKEMSILELNKDKPSKESKPTSCNEEFVDMYICGNYKMQDPANGEVAHFSKYGDCTVSFDNLSQQSRLLIHCHYVLDHMGLI